MNSSNCYERAIKGEKRKTSLIERGKNRNETSGESEKPFTGSAADYYPRLQGHGMTHKVNLFVLLRPISFPSRGEA